MSASIFANKFYPFSLALSLLSAIPYPTLRELRGTGTPYGKMAKRHAQASPTLRILSRPLSVRALGLKLCQQKWLSTEEAEAVPEPSTILVRFVCFRVFLSWCCDRTQTKIISFSCRNLGFGKYSISYAMASLRTLSLNLSFHQ